MSIKICGSRKSAYEKYCEALLKAGTLPILRVDSETPVSAADFGKPWRHLANRPEDRWTKPGGCGDEHCHFMAQAMEAWFFADPDALEEFYGKDKFRKSALPVRQNVEDIPKTDHIPSLESATRHTKKGRYHKMDHGPDILSSIRTALVRARAPHCERIFVELGKIIDAL
ncbi:MAG: DUF4276 family protein [Capsulimonadaceae bacterium]